MISLFRLLFLLLVEFALSYFNLIFFTMKLLRWDVVSL